MNKLNAYVLSEARPLHAATSKQNIPLLLVSQSLELLNQLKNKGEKQNYLVSLFGGWVFSNWNVKVEIKRQGWMVNSFNFMTHSRTPHTVGEASSMVHFCSPLIYISDTIIVVPFPLTLLTIALYYSNLKVLWYLCLCHRYRRVISSIFYRT